MIHLSPGEIRGLAFISERHPNVTLHCRPVRDQADVGWTVVTVVAPIRGTRPRMEYEYWVSPTGRVFRGIGGKRTHVEYRDADYDKPQRLGA